MDYEMGTDNIKKDPSKILDKFFKSWKDMLELIPLMRESVKKGLKKDFEAIVHDDAHIQEELPFSQKTSGISTKEMDDGFNLHFAHQRKTVF